MIQLVYESEATGPVSKDFLADILTVARRRNGEEGLTGMLIYNDGRFVQVLEGYEENVIACFNRIKRDTRHGNIWTLARMEIEKRSFAGWTMGLASASGMPPEITSSLRDFCGVRSRLALLGSSDPKGESAYTARLLNGFLSQFAGPDVPAEFGNKMETSL